MDFPPYPSLSRERKVAEEVKKAKRVVEQVDSTALPCRVEQGNNYGY